MKYSKFYFMHFDKNNKTTKLHTTYHKKLTVNPDMDHVLNPI